MFNDVAIMVGGTGLYIKAFCEGIDSIPESPPEIRKRLVENYERNGLDWLQSEVQKKDLAFWKIAEQQNPHRLIRALEVFEATGNSITTYKTGSALKRPFTIIKIGLELPRKTLIQRIDNRVDAMMDTGLLAEAERLVALQHLQALQTVGYRELFGFFNGKSNLQTAVEQIKINTRQYAKRQMTWFKKDAQENLFIADEVNVKDVVSLLR